jgi:DNA-binding SARP family transcriptional activator
MVLGTLYVGHGVLLSKDGAASESIAPVARGSRLSLRSDCEGDLGRRVQPFQELVERLTDLPLAPPPETKAVHVRVFGQGSVLLRGGDGSYRSVKLAAQQEELLFYLALQPGYSAPSDAAIESLGMADDADPRANLWQKASRARNELRKHMPELGAEQLIVLDRKRGVIRLEASCFSCDATHFNQLAATAAREGVLVEERVALLNTAASLWEGGMLRRAEKKGGQSMAWLDDNSRGLTIRQGYTDAYDKICDRLAADLMTLGRWEEALHVLLSRLREEPALGDLERAAIECCMHLGSRNRLRQLKRELYQLRAAMLADEERGNDWEAEPETLAAYERAEKLLAGVGARRRAEA